MAGYDRDEVPTLSDTHPTLVDESLDSQSQANMSRTRSSISIPMSSMGGDMNRQDKVDENWKKFLAIWKNFFLICCFVASFLDPLFLLLFSAQQDNKCVGASSFKILVVFVVFRSLTDFVYLLNILLKFRRALESRVDDPTRTARINPNDFYEFFLVLPLPLIWVCWGSAGVSAQYSIQVAIVAIYCQYSVRLFRFLPLFVGLIFETVWAIYFINLFTFVLSCHVVGSGWYFLGLQRVKQCLRGACNDTSFGRDTCVEFINCGDENAGNGFRSDPNWINWTKNENATACFSGDSFDYGIFKPAVNLTSKDFITRYVFSLFWGFQQVSTLAGNQQPSYNVLEVLFTMLIIVLGLLVVAFLIGNMQNFLQALDRRKQEFLLRQHDVRQWMSHRRLPKKLKKRVRAAEKYNWEATRGVSEKMLIENLPEDIQKDIRRHMFKFVKAVSIFDSIDQHILDAICERLKQTVYIKGSEILYHGAVVDKMVFIVRGQLESIGDDGTITRLCEGSVCGEELLTWFLEHASVSKNGKKAKVTGQRLLSNRTVRCLSNVEAFSLSLGAADFEEVTCHFASLKKDRKKPTTRPRIKIYKRARPI